ncbi:radical SAM family heme chaperone HemW [Pedobacter sp. HMF7647]|uniref:Heme chaperone HemW n=1 Tax=Hufsiella arboris TaxID=2695275 RepID=A0A7K1Y469_9SPHI|nr:radical SAM family heme chaperone HemW [Hufsiella arboris]MXV49372.1 radical SAM family heme chaperone HemW [Hufsiella arboris]
MAGIYFHIPFCKRACHYCDFHFSTSLKLKDELLEAMKREIMLQKHYLANQKIQTIYFGGGTPSILRADEIQKLLDEISHFHDVDPDAEITMEANPDDLDAEKIKSLRQTQVNRFSIGIQSFFNEDLIWMNRAHLAVEAETSVKRVQDAGFENITADLIYGYPLLTDDKWTHNIDQLIQFDIPHISAYSMTVEPKTALASFIRRGKQIPMDEVQSSAQFIILIDKLASANFEHYEISNFAKPGNYSKHNSNYWNGISYLGIGPSAHSFNGKSRQWNIANNSRYVESLSQNNVPAEIEILSNANRLNEYIMTSLRTIWGMDLNKIEIDFGKEALQLIKSDINQFTEKKWLLKNGELITLSSEGKLFADRIAAELFVDESSFL